MGPFTVQLPIEVDEADRSVVMVGECVSVWLGRRGGESGRGLVVVQVLDVIDLREREREREIRTIKFRQGNTISCTPNREMIMIIHHKYYLGLLNFPSMKFQWYPPLPRAETFNNIISFLSMAVRKYSPSPNYYQTPLSTRISRLC